MSEMRVMYRLSKLFHRRSKQDDSFNDEILKLEHCKMFFTCKRFIVFQIASVTFCTSWSINASIAWGTWLAHHTRTARKT